MDVDVRLITILIVLLASAAKAQEGRCAYMVSIPRPATPDLPPIEDDGNAWNSRPFVSAPAREDVCMNDYLSGTQIIYMEEEIAEAVPIAKLNYAGTQTPIIGIFLSGTRNLLGPEIRQVNGSWYLYITQRQDYETPGMQLYMFNVQINNDAAATIQARISLQIVNIDDNPPIIQLFEACQVPELEEPGLTNCIYEVSDADGEISTRFMKFEIESDRGDDKLFYIEGENINGEWYKMYMKVGTNQSLDFEENALHIFSVTASDSLPNNHTMTLMVQVQNVEHRPPRWVEIFAVQQFDEKTKQNFTVRAIDGDTGINKPIYYKLRREINDTFFSIETIEGGRDGAIFFVDCIDRDELEKELFRLSIIAYKFDNESYATEANIVIIVDDVNDQIPKPLHEEYTIDILEETPLSLNFDKEFGFHDKDLGQNAQYSVHLECEYPPGAEKAFYIAPNVGYQRQTFIMGTTNHSMLDYEVPEFQNILLRVVATDLNRTELVGVAKVYINLINWNDEEPMFMTTSTVVSFNETEGAGFFVGKIEAYDRDIDDKVVHSLMGNAEEYLTIDEDTGDIYVSKDNYFDYHRQRELFIQIRADDTLGEPYHTATSQLTIQLLDINNTPPSLRLPRGSPQVEENVPPGFLIEEGISATDPDTDADLVFEIDWDSSYATKQGRVTPAEEFHGCVEIETLFPNEENHGNATGRIVVREVRPGVTIDFEEFEVLYLSVRVTDLNTVIGEESDELTFTIIIVDMNDNPPVWVDGALTQSFRVRERSGSNIVIGSVLATDIDGPMYNQVRYTIFPIEDTPEGLVKIDFYTGQIEVDQNQAIDADTPPRFHLLYTVVASDRCYEENITLCPPDPEYWETPGNITIEIMDTNNKVPVAESYNIAVEIYENATHGDEVFTFISSDLDRDKIYNSVSYQINYAVNPRLRDFFEVDLSTGLIYVFYTTNDVLDRDGLEPTHRIFLTLIDNFYSEGDGNRNQINAEVLVILLDVNDNAPEMPDPQDLSWRISEGTLAGTTLAPTIYAPDRDEPNTNNSRVGYEILSLTISNRNIEVPELLEIRTFLNEQGEYRGELITTRDLRNFWGTYEIHIRAFDHGDPQMCSNETYTLTIDPYNFHSPEFVFPTPGLTVRIAKELAIVNQALPLVGGEYLHRIEATDKDGLHAGEVSFTIIGDDDAITYFNILNEEAQNNGILRLNLPVVDDIKDFQVTIRATDHGTEPGPLSEEETLYVVFVPTQGDPTFQITTETVRFFEGEGGLEENATLPIAQDLKNYKCVEDCHEIYYRIAVGNTNDHFTLDPKTNVLRVQKPIDREEAESHTLIIAASNLPNAVGIPASTLTVTVIVREADPKPVFQTKLYTAGISSSDTINRELFTVRATHSENAQITYSLDLDSMQVDASLETVKNNAFTLNPSSGVLTLSIQPTILMHGMFEFDVYAHDSEGAFDVAQVKVFLISSQNRVFFLFNNQLQQVEEYKAFVAQTFTAGFNMTCNIDQVLPATDTFGLPLDDVTEVRAHFIRNDLPVPAEDINNLRSDIQLLQTIQNTLSIQLLVLRDLVTGESPDIGGIRSSQLTVYVLGGLSGVLALFSLVLLVVFFIRTRTLNRRLVALTMTKYGSVNSGLNRAGIAAPGTNKHAVEGSNPIWNEAIHAPNFDALSNNSDESDLVGIEDLPQFSADFAEDTGSLQDSVMPQSSIADHSNDFGFNTSPFSTEFANQKFINRL